MRRVRLVRLTTVISDNSKKLKQQITMLITVQTTLIKAIMPEIGQYSPNVSSVFYAHLIRESPAPRSNFDANLKSTNISLAPWRICCSHTPPTLTNLAWLGPAVARITQKHPSVPCQLAH